LMSWYMAGYHTGFISSLMRIQFIKWNLGFYQGMVHQKTLKPKPREETL
jgi:hypothetical protein